MSPLLQRQDRAVSVLVWNYHDDDLPAPPAEVELIVEDVPAARNGFITTD